MLDESNTTVMVAVKSVGEPCKLHFATMRRNDEVRTSVESIMLAVTNV